MEVIIIPHPFRVFDKLDSPILNGAIGLSISGVTLGYAVAKFLPFTFISFAHIYLPYIATGVIVSAIVGIVPQVCRPIQYEAEKTFALTKLQIEDETKKVFKQVPLVVHSHKTDYGYHIIYSLPKGMSYRQVMDKKEYLETALKAEIDMQWTGEYLTMDIMQEVIPNYVDYFIDTDRVIEEGLTLEGLNEDAPSADSRGVRGREVELHPPSDSNFGEV